jgi:plasmid stability protein
MLQYSHVADGGGTVAYLNLDDLDEETAVRLRARAVGNGCSIEEEALNVLRLALDKPGALPQAGQAGGAALPQEPCRRDPRAVQRPRFWGGSTAQKRKP